MTIPSKRWDPSKRTRAEAPKQSNTEKIYVRRPMNNACSSKRSERYEVGGTVISGMQGNDASFWKENRKQTKRTLKKDEPYTPLAVTRFLVQHHTQPYLLLCLRAGQKRQGKQRDSQAKAEKKTIIEKIKVEMGKRKPDVVQVRNSF